MRNLSLQGQSKYILNLISVSCDTIYLVLLAILI